MQLGASHRVIWGKVVPGGGNSRYKGLDVRMSMGCLRNRKDSFRWGQTGSQGQNHAKLDWP